MCIEKKEEGKRKENGEGVAGVFHVTTRNNSVWEFTVLVLFFSLYG